MFFMLNRGGVDALPDIGDACGAPRGLLFHGSVTVGERGQVVIPADARREMGIEPGERLLVFRHSGESMLLMTKIDAFQRFLEHHLELLEQARRTVEQAQEDSHDPVLPSSSE